MEQSLTRRLSTCAFGSIEDRVFHHLDSLEAEKSALNSISSTAPACQVSPWLERTRWSSYLHGCNYSEAADLLKPVREDIDTGLSSILRSVDRLVDIAHASVCADKVNFFGQRRITSFMPHREAYSRPLVVKLQKATYHQYKQVWFKAVTFVFRTSMPECRVKLRHRLNSKQTALFDELLQHTRKSPEADAAQSLDRTCLDFCISLLEERLTGDLYRNATVGFFAVLGIDETNQTLHEASNFTSKLSGFIKIAQLLVLQRAIFAVEDGIANDPLDPLDEMRTRFMCLDQNTPFTWAVSLRSFGKRIRDCTTSLGLIRWSDDAKTLFYHGIELGIEGFRDFVAEQVQKAQQQLECLFLLQDGEQRATVVPRLVLDSLRDDPSIVENGHSFCDDVRNTEFLTVIHRWLLSRVLRVPVLRDEFCWLNTESTVVWRKGRIAKYLADVDAFLETLLLLIHITAGQPARGTEITSLQHTNSSFHRNMFMEDGLIALVTSYHKGYTCTGTTKIIHRYIPVERLANIAAKPSTFLWPNGNGVWSSQRLSDILRRETGTKFKVPLTISTYRHVAIALSRRHLQNGGFKRDYHIEEHYSDHQTTHTSWTAGRLYARGLEEAPGHVESRRAGYREVSRQWHILLGFTKPRLKRKSPFGDFPNHSESKRQKENVDPYSD